MIYLVKEDGLKETKSALGEENFIGVFSYDELKKSSEDFGILGNFAGDTAKNNTVRFESHMDMDVLCIPAPDIREPKHMEMVIHIIVRKGRFLVACRDTGSVCDVIEKIAEQSTGVLTVGRLLAGLFDTVIDSYSKISERIEEEIVVLEEAVVSDNGRKNYTVEILSLRRRLFWYRKYYEHLITVFNYIALNENGLFDSHALRLLKIQSSKTERLYNNTLSFIEYAAHIREAYQAQVDIRLNTIMKVFTVITAIFLPLTLIAGWYGMNFNMPEYSSPYGYIAVIIVSIAVVVVSIGYFKKNNWF